MVMGIRARSVADRAGTAKAAGARLPKEAGALANSAYFAGSALMNHFSVTKTATGHMTQITPKNRVM